MSAYSDKVIADGASHYWRLNQTSGTSAVDSVGTAHGTISGGVTLGQAGALTDGDKAMSFDGVTGKVLTTGTALNCGPSTQSFSVEFWSKGPYPAGQAGIFLKGTFPFNNVQYGWEIRQVSAAQWQFIRNAGTPAAPAALGWPTPTPTAWSHLIVTYDAVTGVATAYVNGAQVGTITWAGADKGTYTDTYPVQMGQSAYGVFTGTLDDVSIYPRALTPAEIAAHYTVGTTRLTNDLNTGLYTYLVGVFGLSGGTSYAERVKADGATNHWRLGESSGTTAIDAIGGANGTLSGGVTLNQPSALADGNAAMTFNGTTGKIAVTGVTIPVVATIEAWAQTALNTGAIVLSIASPELDIGVNQNVGPKILCYTGTTAYSSTELTPGWHHLVVVLGATTTLFYVDGVLDGTVAQVHAANSGQMMLGCVFTAGHSFWTGGLDDIAIYPRALTANEVAAHSSLGRSGLSGGNDLTTLITRYLATLTGDMTARWKQMEKNAGF